MRIALASIRRCLDGAVPAAVATCADDGVPNVSYVSEVQYVDETHVALSYQFFNKTRRNVLANPFAMVLVIDPECGAQFELSLRYLSTVTSGPVFESMRVKLAGIAAHTGMSSVFRLLGSDLYEVTEIVPIGKAPQDASFQAPPQLALLRAVSDRLAACDNLETLVDTLLDALAELLDIPFAMIFLHDEAGARLYLIGSRGYEVSGIGSEWPLGYGIIGLAGAECTPVRISHFAEEYRYGDAVRKQWSAEQPPGGLETAIPLPGLRHPASQLAVPFAAGGHLQGVLCVESLRDGEFDYDSEDLLVAIANQFAAGMPALRGRPTQSVAGSATRVGGGPPLHIRFIDETASVFIDDDYLIKGVSGAIFWKLVREYANRGRTLFSNRELRHDPEIRLPEYSENLEARLLLLKRRLQERSRNIAIVSVARGKFRLDVDRPIVLEAADGAGRAQRPA